MKSDRTHNGEFNYAVLYPNACDSSTFRTDDYVPLLLLHFSLSLVSIFICVFFFLPLHRPNVLHNATDDVEKLHFLSECIRQADFRFSHDDLRVTSPLNFMQFMVAARRNRETQRLLLLLLLFVEWKCSIYLFRRQCDHLRPRKREKQTKNENENRTHTLRAYEYITVQRANRRKKTLFRRSATRTSRKKNI